MLENFPVIMATTNKTKKACFYSLAEIFNSRGTGSIRMYELDELGLEMPEVDECGKRYIENATIKTEAVLNMLNRNPEFKPPEIIFAIIADDSGLEFPMLDGWPGIHTARCNDHGKYPSVGKCIDTKINESLEDLEGFISSSKLAREQILLEAETPESMKTVADIMSYKLHRCRLVSYLSILTVRYDPTAIKRIEKPCKLICSHIRSGTQECIFEYRDDVDSTKNVYPIIYPIGTLLSDFSRNATMTTFDNRHFLIKTADGVEYHTENLAVPGFNFENSVPSLVRSKIPYSDLVACNFETPEVPGIHNYMEAPFNNIFEKICWNAS